MFKISGTTKLLHKCFFSVNLYNINKMNTVKGIRDFIQIITLDFNC